MSGETATRGVQGVGLFEDEHRSVIGGARCMRVLVYSWGCLKMNRCVGHSACVCICVNDSVEF